MAKRSVQHSAPTIRSPRGNADTRRSRASSARRRPRARQPELFAPRRGGARRGAGRKPKGARPQVSHARRAPLDARHPVHVTTRLRAGLPSLRRVDELRVLLRSFRAAQARQGMRLVHFSIQSNHLHLIVEAQDELALARGMQGLLVRIARALNRCWDRAGKLFADRYHAHVLRSALEVRRALVYVLQNSRKHGLAPRGVDAFSSGAWFEGWAELPALRERMRSLAERLRAIVDGGNRVRAPSAGNTRTRTDGAGRGVVDRARTWLLACGWKRHGAVHVLERPGN